MKIINKPIEMVSVFKPDGSIKLVRFRIETDDAEWKTIHIKATQNVFDERINTKETIRKFTCSIEINDTKRLCEIHYNLYTLKWTLAKI